MGNTKSNQDAKRFFDGVNDVLEKGFNTGIDIISMPTKMMNAISNFLSSPLGGIVIPIMAIGGLYVVTQIKK